MPSGLHAPVHKQAGRGGTAVLKLANGWWALIAGVIALWGGRGSGLRAQLWRESLHLLARDGAEGAEDFAEDFEKARAKLAAVQNKQPHEVMGDEIHGGACA